jgi:quinol monooxygenase YgiN
MNSGHGLNGRKAAETLHQALKTQITDYKNLEDMLNYQALKVTLLNPGAFSAYMDYQQSQGADLAHTKPPHMKPTAEQMKTLLQGKRLK